MPAEHKIDHEQLIDRLESIERRYNPDKDLNCEVPVSFGTIALVQAVKELIKEIEYLRQEQDAIKELIYLQPDEAGPDDEAEALAAMQDAWNNAQAKQDEAGQ